MRTLSIYLTAVLLAAGFAVSAVTLGIFHPRSYSAFAGLYHQGTPVAGTVHLALDCNVAASGTQDDCYVEYYEVELDVAVTIANSTGSATSVGAFQFSVINPDILELDAVAVDSGSLCDRNPDMNETYVTGTFVCGEVDDDLGGVPGGERSALYAFTSDATGPELPSDNAHRTLATVHYDVPATAFQGLFTTLTLENVYVADNSGAEIGSCNPVIVQSMRCFGASIEFVNPGGGCYQDHDCDGFLDNWPASWFHEGPQNTNYNVDNCPAINPNSQGNYDGNFTDISPPKAYDDLTRPMSDWRGDDCDPDIDNDGRPNFDETLGNNCGAFSPSFTGPYGPDSDGDRVLDGWECTSATDPADAGSAPSLASCQTSGDADVDGVFDSRERCYYGTSTSMVNSDGDTLDDSCEIASVNADLSVNVIDLQQIAQHTLQGGQGYLLNMDLNKDGQVNVLDLQYAAARSIPCP